MKINKVFTFTLLLAITFFCPFLSEAKELTTCTYQYENQELVYKINRNNVELPFEDGTKIGEKVWYNGYQLSDQFLRASKTSSGNTCPTITVEENEDNVIVLLNPIDPEKCNGTCKTINAIKQEQRSDVLETRIGKSVGLFQRTSYVVPYFRLLENKEIEWSIDGKNYTSIKNTISYDKDNEISVDKTFAKNIFTKDENIIKIYRCVSKKSGNYYYTLSENNNSCLNKELSEEDGQALESVSYNGALGASCTDTILGDPADEDSTAWLLKQIFNYLKVLGPMIILVMSAIDFTKAIVSGDDETMQKCYKRLIQRLVLAVALFVVPTLVEVLFDVFGITGGPVCVLD